MKKLSGFLVALMLPAVAFTAEAPAGGSAEWRPLLDAKLSNFDVYLSYPGTVIKDVVAGYLAPAWNRPIGLNPPKQNVFTVIQQDGRPVLHITGEIYGCVQTRESFSNYHLRLETRWGGKKWEPRLNEPKDSGILYHSRGPFGVDYWKSWALSHEFQIVEHGLGEYWAQASAAMDVRADPKATRDSAPRWNPAAPWGEFTGPENNHVLAGSDEDQPGHWNRLELICFQDECLHIVNGRVVMALAHARYKDKGTWVPMTGGKLQIQSEAAEVFYRNIEIRSITALPPEYRRYFE